MCNYGVDRFCVPRQVTEISAVVILKGGRRKGYTVYGVLNNYLNYINMQNKHLSWGAFNTKCHIVYKADKNQGFLILKKMYMVVMGYLFNASKLNRFSSVKIIKNYIITYVNDYM